MNKTPAIKMPTSGQKIHSGGASCQMATIRVDQKSKPRNIQHSSWIISAATTAPAADQMEPMSKCDFSTFSNVEFSKNTIAKTLNMEKVRIIAGKSSQTDAWMCQHTQRWRKDLLMAILYIAHAADPADPDFDPGCCPFCDEQMPLGQWRYQDVTWSNSLIHSFVFHGAKITPEQLGKPLTDAIRAYYGHLLVTKTHQIQKRLDDRRAKFINSTVA